MTASGLLLFTMLPAMGIQQTNEPTRFRVNVQLVQVDVYVEREGKAVVGLAEEDFELFDNGELQRIDRVEVETTPLTVALVLDTSASVAGPKLTRLKAASRALLEGFDEGDQAGLITFSHRLQERAALTPVLGGLHDAIEEVRAAGATAWHDALFAGLKMVEEVPPRTMVLLFTDGQDTYSWLPRERLTHIVEQSNALVYIVDGSESAPSLPLGPMSARGLRIFREENRERRDRKRFLAEVAEASAGRLIEAASTDLSAAFLEILAEMKTRYLLTYSPSSLEPGWHDIEVELAGGEAEIRSRRGYFYEP